MKVMALDGNSLVYRAFFALPDTMATASGEVTNAVFGFCSMFVTLVKDHDPDAVVVVFDRKEKTFRHEAAPEYKAQREKQPDTLYHQLAVVRDELLPAAGVTTLDCAGFEGDDIIATIAQGISPNDELLIVTGDRDAYQLVSDPNIRVLYNKRGVSDYALYDEAGIKERTGVTPHHYAEYAALRGDPSDNLEGVPGVGEKTAAKLINQYGSLAAVFDHADEQTPKLKASLHESRERVLRNAGLMRLRSDVPVAVDASAWKPRPNVDALQRLFSRLEFSSMASRWKPILAKFGGGTTGSGGTSDKRTASNPVGESEVGDGHDGVGESLEEISVTVTPASREQALDILRAKTPLGVAVVWDGEPGRSAIRAIIAASGTSATAPGPRQCWLIAVDHLLEKAHAEALSTSTHVVMHDARNAMRGLLAMGIDITQLSYDTAIAAYLVDSGSGAYDVATVASRWLHLRIAGDGTTASGQLDFDTPIQDSLEYAAACEAVVAVLVRPVLERELQNVQLSQLYFSTELPLVRVLAKMEHVGIAVDHDALRALEQSLGTRSSELIKQLHALAGREFNVNSTKQLKEILFEERGLTGGRKTKATKGYSTDAASLEKIRDEWPEFIDALMEYREVEKLRATYATGLLHSIAKDGRIHASFNQTVARTGRLSSDQPNLHNIPIRNESGKVFREVFVPAPHCEFMVADYNQIELRCIAHLAQDPGLLAAFNAGVDIHRATAAQVFDVPLDEVNSDQRSKAKMVSYGLAYGMEAYGLSQRLGIDVAEAKVILDAYFAAFPRVKRYMDNAVATATREGYTTTLFGRRRQIEGIHSSIRQVQAAAARMAMNAAIQGLAADIFKIALVAIDQGLEAAGMTSRLVLQVHDEVIVEVTTGERERVEALVLRAMQNAARLDVPLVVNAAWGASWAAAKVA
ncbi:DNA polymerase I [Actinomycetes bacterium]|nr:DNA polymerase I [Actinomycetes bacterium]